SASESGASVVFVTSKYSKSSYDAVSATISDTNTGGTPAVAAEAGEAVRIAPLVSTAVQVARARERARRRRAPNAGMGSLPSVCERGRPEQTPGVATLWTAHCPPVNEGNRTANGGCPRGERRRGLPKVRTTYPGCIHAVHRHANVPQCALPVPAHGGKDARSARRSDDPVRRGDGSSFMDVSVERLELHYGDFHAIRGIDLHVPDGSSLVLLGQSGCGKTTTMRSIAGLEQPSAGSISIGGKTLFDARSRTNVPPNKRNIGMVFQSYA